MMALYVSERLRVKCRQAELNLSRLFGVLFGVTYKFAWQNGWRRLLKCLAFCLASPSKMLGILVGVSEGGHPLCACQPFLTGTRPPYHRTSITGSRISQRWRRASQISSSAAATTSVCRRNANFIHSVAGSGVSRNVQLK
jgi:hypothetical protein